MYVYLDAYLSLCERALFLRRQLNITLSRWTVLSPRVYTVNWRRSDSPRSLWLRQYLQLLCSVLYGDQETDWKTRQRLIGNSHDKIFSGFHIILPDLTTDVPCASQEDILYIRRRWLLPLFVKIRPVHYFGASSINKLYTYTCKYMVTYIYIYIYINLLSEFIVISRHFI